MRRVPLFSLVLVLLFTGAFWMRVGRKPAAPNTAILWLLGPSAEQDFVHASTTEADLRRRLGPGEIQPDTIWLGEGSFELGTIVYPNDPGRRFQIAWEDSAHTRPQQVRVRGQRTEWRVYPGITLGTRLSTLDSMNGAPLSVVGFEWDHPGGVTSYNGGTLDTLWSRGRAVGRLVELALTPDSGAPNALTRRVAGDHVFSSRMPALKALNPRVWSMIVVPR